MSDSHEQLRQRADKVLCNTYGRYPLAVSRAEGSRLYDFDGREYVDLLSGIAVTSLGHCHPELNQAMAEQARKLVHVSNLFYQEPQVALAETLLSTCSADRVFFCNSGAEANEAAIKLARRYMRTIRGNEAFEVITLEGSFHGRTLATIAATGQSKVKEGFEPMPAGFVTVPWNDLDALERAMGEATAAVLVEVIQGEGGVREMDAAHAAALQELCRRKGVLLMVDEVQTGLCRTGSFWAHQLHGLRPDVLTTAKALANGLPMGAMMTTEEIARAFTPGSHATTFGGGPVPSAVAGKVLEIMLRDGLDRRAAALGEHALGRFHELMRAMPDRIASVRGRGLMLGIELAEISGVDPQAVWSALLERGFVLNLTQGAVLRLLPPLTIARADLDAFADALEDVLGTS